MWRFSLRLLNYLLPYYRPGHAGLDIGGLTLLPRLLGRFTHHLTCCLLLLFGPAVPFNCATALPTAPFVPVLVRVLPRPDMPRILATKAPSCGYPNFYSPVAPTAKRCQRGRQVDARFLRLPDTRRLPDTCPGFTIPITHPHCHIPVHSILRADATIPHPPPVCPTYLHSVRRGHTFWLLPSFTLRAPRLPWCFNLGCLPCPFADHSSHIVPCLPFWDTALAVHTRHWAFPHGLDATPLPFCHPATTFPPPPFMRCRCRISPSPLACPAVRYGSTLQPHHTTLPLQHPSFYPPPPLSLPPPTRRIAGIPGPHTATTPLCLLFAF